MSDASELLAELLGKGLTKADVGRAVGRDRSLIGQVAAGRKPGHNLVDSLRALTTRLEAVEDRQAAVRAVEAAPVTAPARRTTAAGGVARVRRRTRWEGAGGSTTLVKRQAARSGGKPLARQLARASGSGRVVAATATFDRTVYVEGTSGGKAGAGMHATGTVTMLLGTAEDVAAEAGGDVSSYVVGRMVDAGYVSFDSDYLEDATTHLVALELRTFEPRE